MLWFLLISSKIFSFNLQSFWINLKDETIPSSDHWTSFSGGLSDKINSLAESADSARLFILSDSPPEKDVQWSEEGIVSSFKFIQKLWRLNEKILEEINKNHSTDFDDQITRYTNKYLKKVHDNLESCLLYTSDAADES